MSIRIKHVYSSVVYRDELIIAGKFKQQGNVFAAIGKENDREYSIIIKDFNGEVNKLEIFNEKVIAGGSFSMQCDNNQLIEKIGQWDGSAWTNLSSEVVNGNILALAVYNGNLVIGGDFSKIGNNDFNGLALWNGTSWSHLVNEDLLTVKALFVHNGDLIIGCKTSSCDNVVLKLSGTTWSTLGANAVDCEIGFIAYINNNLAVGECNFADVYSVSPKVYVLDENSNQWTLFGA